MNHQADIIYGAAEKQAESNGKIDPLLLGGTAMKKKAFGTIHSPLVTSSVPKHNQTTLLPHWPY